MIRKRNKNSEFLQTRRFLQGIVFLPVESRRIFSKMIYTATFMFCMFTSFAQKQKLASPHIVKVAVVMQDPRIPSMGNKRLHELFKTPGYTFQWNDPWKLAEQYRDSLNAISHGVVKYEFVKIYDESIFFTKLKNSNELLSLDKLIPLLSEPGWATFKKEGTQFDYNAFIQHYGFCEMRDRNEINEVWLWSFPYAGGYESTFAGENAFWLNSDPVSNTNCKDLLVVMGLNYEREMSMALESYGHRVESIMRKVYGRWDNKAADPNTWELYTTIDKVSPGNAQVGNIHYPPNGNSDYDWINKRTVSTYADVWYSYPNINKEGKKSREVDCKEWQCSHSGYMSWWFRHLPHYEGINAKDGHLNNWWEYVVDYNAAIKKEQQLKNKHRKHLK
jgi:hypothetical protein